MRRAASAPAGNPVPLWTLRPGATSASALTYSGSMETGSSAAASA
jgi:hypothetical protein